MAFLSTDCGTGLRLNSGDPNRDCPIASAILHALSELVGIKIIEPAILRSIPRICSLASSWLKLVRSRLRRSISLMSAAQVFRVRIKHRHSPRRSAGHNLAISGLNERDRYDLNCPRIGTSDGSSSHQRNPFAQGPLTSIQHRFAALAEALAGFGRSCCATSQGSDWRHRCSRFPESISLACS